MKTRVRIPTLSKVDGVKAQTAKERAEALNNFFASVYQNQSDGVPIQNSVFSGTALSNINIIREMVMNKLNSLNTGKSTGPDGLHPHFLIQFRTPLTILFKISLSEGIVPSQWIEAYITAIHKKGIKNVVENYRPISITSKLESAGIKGEVLQWIISFLTNRRHRVSVEGKLSNWVYVKSGFPQGSVLGPILLDIFYQ